MVNSGDTGFVLICAAFVFFMTPGLALFYGGLGRRKNVVNTMLSSLFLVGVSIVLWVLVGYSLSFSGNIGGVIGNLDWIGMKGVGMEAGPYSDNIPNVWGQGGLLGDGLLHSVDFAGGNVVHISSGASALVLCIALGKRQGYESQSYRIHNIPMVALGASILVFGWFGFNAGSALSANGLAAHAFMTTATSCGAAMVSWMFIEVMQSGKPSLVGAATGLVAGLVAITPGAGFVPIWSAVIIGIIVSPICYFMIAVVKKKFGYDDALDAFGCHGIGGMWGGIATGIFGLSSINSVAEWNGLCFGNTKLFIAQVVSILVTIVVAIVGTLICLTITKLITPIRVSKKDELIGLDKSEHSETAYPSFNGFD